MPKAKKMLKAFPAQSLLVRPHSMVERAMTIKRDGYTLSQENVTEPYLTLTLDLSLVKLSSVFYTRIT